MEGPGPVLARGVGGALNPFALGKAGGGLGVPDGPRRARSGMVLAGRLGDVSPRLVRGLCS